MWVDLKQFFFGRKVSDNSPQVATFTDDGKLRTDAEVTVGDVQVNFPETFPLPQAQVDELRNVTVQATIGEVEIKNEVGNPVPVRTGADLHPLGEQLTPSQIGLVTQTVIHGETTGQGGGYRDVKVTPSGALTVEATVENEVTVIHRPINRVTGSASLAPAASGVLLAHIATTTEKAHSLSVSGNGDALIEVFKNSVKQDECRLSAIQRRESIFLGFALPIGSNIEVRVSCSALATADFFAAYLYE